MSRIALPNLRIAGLRQFSFGDPVYDRANLYPNLDLDFATNKNLTDNRSGKTSLVSFSRSAASSPGTYVGADGLIKTAAVNLLLYSEQFDNAAWTKYSSGTGVAPAIVSGNEQAPDGKNTASEITFSVPAPVGESFVRVSPTVIAGDQYTGSFYVKGEGANVGKTILFRHVGKSTFLSIVLTADWQRIERTETAFSISQPFDIGLRPGINGTAPDTVTAILWGAQLEETDAALMGPSPYIKTTSQALCAPRFDHGPTSGNITTNLLLYSEMLDNTSVWTQLSSPTVTANNDTAPDGTETADDITDPSTSYSGIQQSFTGITGVQYATSLYLKKISVAPTSYPAIQLARGDGTLTTIIINLQTGAINPLIGGSRVAPDSYSAVSDGDYWRITSVTTSAGTSMSYTLYPAFSLNGTSATATATGTVTAWGAQLETSSSAGPYVRTLSKTRSISDAVAPSLGLLVEEQRTNLFIDSVLAGTPFVSGAGIAVTYTNDSLYSPGRRVRIQTTAAREYRELGVTTFTVSPNTSYTISAWVDVVQCDALGIRQHIGHRFPPSGATQTWYVDGVPVSLGYVIPPGRHFIHVTMAVGSTTGALAPFIGSGISNNSTADITFDTPQYEVGSFPTSYIPTEGSTQTRYADIASVEGADFSTTNLLSYSESFDVKWSRGGMNPVSANQIAAPDGQTTADLATESTFTGTHVLYDSLVTAAANYTWSVYAKKKERTWIKLGLSTGAANGAFFDLDNGAVGAVDSGYSATIDDAGNGWYRCKLTKTTTAALHYHAVYLASDGSTTSYAGDGTSGVYLWGAMLTATEYPVEYVTTRNVLTHSQDFERSGWVKVNGSLLDDDVTQAPDGTMTADRIRKTTTSLQAIRQNTITVPGVVVESVYAKKDSTDNISFTDSALPVLNISLVDGSILANSGAFSNVSVSYVGNGWFRISYSRNASSGVLPLYMWPTNQTGLSFNTFGAPTASAYIWGAQLEPGTTATEYVRTTDVVGKKYNWYEPTEGTVFVTSTRYSNDNAFQRAVTFGSSSPSITNQFSILKYSTLEAGYLASPGLQLNKPLISAGTEMRSAFAAKIGDHAFTINGASPATSAVSQGIGDGMVQMLIGHTAGPGQIQNGHIKRIIYFPRRIKDSNLVLMTE